MRRNTQHFSVPVSNSSPKTLEDAGLRTGKATVERRGRGARPTEARGRMRIITAYQTTSSDHNMHGTIRFIQQVGSDTSNIGRRPQMVDWATFPAGYPVMKGDPRGKSNHLERHALRYVVPSPQSPSHFKKLKLSHWPLEAAKQSAKVHATQIRRELCMRDVGPWSNSRKRQGRDLLILRAAVGTSAPLFLIHTT